MISRFWVLVFWGAFLSSSVFSSEIQVSLSSQMLRLGQVIHVQVVSPEKLTTAKLSFLKRSFRLFLLEKSQSGYVYHSYIAASRSQKRGSYVLKVQLKAGKTHRFFQNYAVKLDVPKTPKRGKVGLTKRAKGISQDKKAYRHEGRLLSGLFRTLTETRYFSGPFLRPAEGRMSSGFAVLRRYNNGSTSSHAGVDIANKLGTRVIAPENGTVLLSDSLKIHGNTVLLDHGFGIVSVFCHMDSLGVNTGDVIEKGQLLGKMGMSGVASGVHLHWGLSVQNVRVDPLYWVGDRFSVR